MNIQAVRSIAKTRGIKYAKLSKADLIRTIQREEGNFPCFGTCVDGSCDQFNCAWRADCLPPEKRTAC